MDLIDRAALWQTFGEAQKSDPMADHGRGYADNFLNDAMEPSTEWFAVEEMVLKQPTIEAVPLDKLCEWLDYHAGKPLDCVGEQCIKCKFGVTDSGNGNCWKAMLTKWMEGLDGTD